MTFRLFRRSSPAPTGEPGSRRRTDRTGARGRVDAAGVDETTDRAAATTGATSSSSTVAASAGAWLAPGDGGARLEIVSRAGCHLCERTAVALGPVAERHGASLVLLDVDADPELAGYSDAVPVVRIDGVEVDRLMVDVGRVERVLGEGLSEGSPRPR